MMVLGGWKEVGRGEAEGSRTRWDKRKQDREEQKSGAGEGREEGWSRAGQKGGPGQGMAGQKGGVGRDR